MLAGALGAVNIEAVSVSYFNDRQLTTLREYFGGKEYCGRRTYLRTILSQKHGMYLVTDLDTKMSEIPGDAKFVVDYIVNSDGVTRTVTLPVSHAAGYMGKAVYIGLSDISDPEEKLLAWRIAIFDGAGYPMARYESFLWRMPDKGK